ncbi:MAG: phosphoribosylformylglycinamidine cyclo-ligase [Arenicellales bacterium]|jgi:phosphoribosylformylglycinamidine cyclo-ligase|nr:phosphoribosylformylglycinamidine cyclo-ligase [Arenicellales bacterium]|tara:strand:+ start:1067 stop:2119 length:1053 start_codon:yes stop_codon:yes gene_type:complete
MAILHVSHPNDPPLTYRDAGVDIEAGESLVERIKPLVQKTQRPECLGNIGGFGGLFELPIDRYRRPVLVSGTDGVGTKLKLAVILDRHDTIGIDLVAMCVNDVLVLGAEPLYFLDYFATGRLSPEHAQSVIAGIATGCEAAGAALIGGETAEMPGMYSPGEYDLAGFCVGVVEKDQIIDGSHIRAGDQVLGLASSGLHSNGYSLARAVLERSSATLDQAIGETTLGEALLAPTRIYVRPILALLKAVPIHGIAHITGGGLPGNIPRVLPGNCDCRIDATAWPRPEIFQWLQSEGSIDDTEMLRTFNCGIGLVIIVSSDTAAQAHEMLEASGETVYRLGEVQAGSRGIVFD